jgi:hypothetical protein
LNSDPPQYQPPPEDPNLALLAQQNREAGYAAIQDRVSASSAALMTRYGARLSLAGTNTSGSPLFTPPTAAVDLGAPGTWVAPNG